MQNNSAELINFSYLLRKKGKYEAIKNVDCPVGTQRNEKIM